jgi:carboxymethylenebutenolidase
VIAPEHEHDVKVYPEAGHAFAWPPDVSAVVQGLSRLVGMNAAHVPDAADDAWGRVDRFFAEHLRG